MQCAHIRHTKSGTEMQCRNHAKTGGTLCQKHHEKSFAPTINPYTYKRHRYTDYIPRGLQSKYERAQEDQDLLSLKQEIALADVRIQHLLQQMPDDAATLSPMGARECLNQIGEFFQKQDYASVESLADRLSNYVESTEQATSLWEDIQRVIELRRKLAETEYKRNIMMSTMISTERMLGLMSFITSSIQNHVTRFTQHDSHVGDQIILGISEDLRTVLFDADGQQPTPGHADAQA